MKTKVLSLLMVLFMLAMGVQAQITLHDPVITDSYMAFVGENQMNNYRFTLDTYEWADRGPQFQLTIEPIDATKWAHIEGSDLTDPNYWEPMFRQYTSQMAGKEMTAQDNVKRLYVKNVSLQEAQFKDYTELHIIGIEAGGDYAIPDKIFMGDTHLETFDCNVQGTLMLGSDVVNTQPNFTVIVYTQQSAEAWNKYKVSTGANLTVDDSNVGGGSPVSLYQVPNGSFADWEERNLPAEMGGGSYTSPSGYWDTFNILAPGCVTKTEGRTAGSTAALLESKVVDMSAAGMPGEAVTTSLLVTDCFLKKMSGSEYEEGVPCNNIPARYLTFWYKYQPVTGDVAQVFIQFNEDLVIKPQVTRTVKFRKKITEAASDWTFGYIDLSVSENGKDPSGLGWGINAFYIDITSSVSGMSSSTEGSGASAPGSKLWITELQFASEVTGIENVLSNRTNASSVRYNLSGQRIKKGYKGIVVENGHKVLVK